MSNRDLRIVFYQSVPHHGGASRCTVEFAQRLKDYAKVTIVDTYGTCGEYREAVEKAGLDYEVVWPQEAPRLIGGWGSRFRRSLCLATHSLHMLRLAARTAKVMDRLEPSVISTDNFKSAMVLAIHRRLRRIPVCYFLHNWYRPPQMTRVGRWLCRHRADGILGVSYATMGAVICAGIPGKKVRALRNPINVAKIEELSGHTLDCPLPQADRPVRVLLPAGIRRVKGHLDAVKAMQLLLDMRHDAVLWLPGDFEGVGLNAGYVDEIKQLVRKLDIEDRVEWIGMRHDMPQVMKATTHMILPSAYEGHPRAIMEGMALQRPFVVTPAGGCTDMVIPGLTGYLCQFDSPRSLADALDEAIRKPDKTRRMAETAYEWVKEEFTPERHTQELMSFYRKVANREL